MFTKVCVKNFKCFSDLEFDLTDRHGDPKHLIMIYGENGAGKTNIAAIFYALMELLRTMNVEDIYRAMLEQKDEEWFPMARFGIRDIPAITKDYRMIDTDGNILMHFDFKLQEKAGSYEVEFNEDEVVHEKLEFVWEKKKVTYFDFMPDGGKLRDQLFTDKDLLDDLITQKKKFWGKHLFLSILIHEVRTKSRQYISNSITENFDQVLEFFGNIGGTMHQREINRQFPRIWARSSFSLARGRISAERQTSWLERYREFVKTFFCSINPNIADVFYKIESEDESFRTYQLYFKKKICGKIREIDFSQESTGNQQMLNLLSGLVFAANGGVEILDEMDSGIHDIAAQKMLTELVPALKGQLIITTHNSLLMDCDFAREATYLLTEDEDANRALKCITESSERIYQKTNIRNKYISGTYEGIPEIGKIDFKKLTDIWYDRADSENTEE